MALLGAHLPGLSDEEENACAWVNLYWGNGGETTSANERAGIVFRIMTAREGVVRSKSGSILLIRPSATTSEAGISWPSLVS